MAKEINWARAAIRDLGRLQGFLEDKSKKAALRALKTIKTGISRLEQHPHIGIAVEDMPNYRDLIIPFGSGNYVARYEVDGDCIIIARLKHSQQSTF